MHRITAINEDTDVEDEDDTRVTKEAEETIVMSEYIRAMKLQKDNHIDDALSLFTQLLQTQVLYEVTASHTCKTLKSIKYNCYKNIGFIYKEKNNNDKALEFLIEAIEMDDTDIFTLNKLGQIALSMKQWNVAQIAFEKCLKKNANYWPAGDGILQILCQCENYNEAYGWALLWYEKNPKYQFGLDVILEIRDRFRGSGFEYFENSWSIKFKDTSLKRTNKKSVFPVTEYTEPTEDPKPNIEQFKMDSFENENWLSVGTMICGLYEHLKSANLPLTTKFKYADFLRSTSTEMEEKTMEVEEVPTIGETDVDMDGTTQTPPPPPPPPTTTTTTTTTTTEEDVPMEEKQDNGSSDGMKCSNSNNADGPNSGEGSNDDSDAPTTTGDEEPKNTSTRSKQSRRRGSELKSLEPWCNWDRNRKYSQRQKNKQIERMENDTTVNGFLRKILKKYFNDDFDDESPFHPGQKYSQLCNTSSNGEKSSDENVLEGSSDNFQAATAELYASFIAGIKTVEFDAIDLVKMWTQYIAMCWNYKMPGEIIDLYKKFYCYYTEHYDLAAWNQLNSADFQDAFRMTLFYLELKHVDAFKTAKIDAKNECDDEWIKVYHPFIFYCGIYEENDDKDEALHQQIRSTWLQYSIARYEYDLQRSVGCLEAIKDLIQANDRAICLHLPNIDQFQKVDMSVLDESIIALERTISLNNVRQLYQNKNYEELIGVLQNSLVITTKTKHATSTVMKVSTQFEIVLECFWNVNMFDDCFIWSERCLRYALDAFVAAKKDSPAYQEWAANVNFILTYIEAIIMEKSYMVLRCLKTFCARLVQSLVRIVTAQLDAPPERNINHLHPINLKKPWIILHHIVQREDDMKSHQSKKNKTAVARKESTDSDETNEATNENGANENDLDEEETIPNAIAILFTAHEYLGSRMWCTRDNGQLLLFGLELVVPLLRTPYLEPYRDVVAEYLEQITYCLYGYPAKRARLKHIEEHDAQNVDLEWNQAVLLYDLYRPDDLPEYDSYKNDSITAETEQLLQKILPLLPEDIDPSKQSQDMEKFISGESNELPEALNILPSRINSIYYLIADHHFKNRDFSKAVKYYTSELSNYPTRFDAWAGMALSKASMMETKLNACTSIPTKEWIQQSDEVLRSFKQCLQINGKAVPLWIEYGSYAYALHSYCSRCLKQSSDTLTMEQFEALEEKKNDCLTVAHDCFITIDALTPINEADKKSEDDEKWLYHYMLGKVSEKRKDAPNIVIDHYLKSAQYLYEHNATYPFKINSSSPQNLALEALEVFYRVTAVIVKYLEQHSVVTTAIGRYFIKILKQQAKSPFAMSKAKINENSVNAFKRKISMAHEEAAKQKMAKVDTSSVSKNTDASAEARKLSTEDKTDNMDTENNNEKPATVNTNEPIADATSRTDQETGEIIQEDGEKTVTNEVDVNAESMEVQEHPNKSPMNESLAGKTSVPETPNDEAPKVNTPDNTPPKDAIEQTAEIPIDGDDKIVSDDDDVIIVETPGEPEKMDADDSSSVGAPSSITTRTASERDDTSRNSFEKVEPASNPIITNIIEDEAGNSPMRRGSQESSTTTTTTTTTTTGSETTSSSSESTSTDSSSSDSDDTSSSEDDLNKDPNTPLDVKYIELIYEMCIKNLEECVTRFPEHYKSIFRLVQVYLHGPSSIKNVEKCNQLLLGTYTTALGNQIQGLFTDRKNTNLFNGIWRNPSSEIDRPGSFSSHLSKCVNILMQILRKNLDFKLLLEIISHLQRVPDVDKRYIKESERKELLEHAMAFCLQSFKDLIRKHSVEQLNDDEMLILIVEIFKAHKKCLKNASQKDSPYAGALVDAFKAYIQGKVDWLPENVIYIDLATKLCNIEIIAKKNQEKQLQQPPVPPPPTPQFTGRRNILEERGFTSLAATLSKYVPPPPAPIVMPTPSVHVPSVIPMNPGLSITPTSAASMPLIPVSISTAMPIPSMASITPVTITATSSAPASIPMTSPAMTVTMINQPVAAPIQSRAPMPATAYQLPGARPRGRPPGSKNTTSKAIAAPANLSMTANPIAALLQPSNLARPLPDLNLMTCHLEPSIQQSVLNLLSTTTFMQTLARFPESTSMKTFLYEYLRLSNFQQIPQLVVAFMDVMGRLAASMSVPSTVPTLAKPPKGKKPPATTAAATKQPAMSITPIPLKHPTSTSAAPIPNLNPGMAATVTPVPHSVANYMSPGASTVISVGSGQLTITPSISITANPQPPPTSLPQLPLPNFNVAKPSKPPKQPKEKAKVGPKAMYPDLGMNITMDLPKSLSIIPSMAAAGSSMGPKLPIPAPPMNVEIVPKPKKASAKRSIEPKQHPQAQQTQPKTNILQSHSYIKPNMITPQAPPSSMMVVDQMKHLLHQQMTDKNFMSQFHQFLSADPKNKQNIPMSAPSTQAQGMIKVKQMDQLTNKPKAAPRQKSVGGRKAAQPQPFNNLAAMGVNKGQSMATNTVNLMHSYGLPNVMQSMPSSAFTSTPNLPAKFSPVNLQMSMAGSMAATPQASSSKSLQQRLAERQQQFNNGGAPSRPSSTSSATSVNTSKTDNDIIVLE